MKKSQVRLAAGARKPYQEAQVKEALADVGARDPGISEEPVPRSSSQGRSSSSPGRSLRKPIQGPPMWRSCGGAQALHSGTEGRNVSSQGTEVPPIFLMSRSPPHWHKSQLGREERGFKGQKPRLSERQPQPQQAPSPNLHFHCHKESRPGAKWTSLRAWAEERAWEVS